MKKLPLLALLILALAAVPAQAAHPYAGAQILYVGLEAQSDPVEGFTGYGPVGLRAIRLGDPKAKARVLTGGRSDAQPAVSPDGRWVAFASKGIVLMRIDGSGLRQVTSGRAADRSPVFSPNGRQVVFGRTPANKGFQHLYSARSDGSQLRDLTPRIPARRRPGERNFSAEDPAFSPNGRTIAFTVSNNGGGENVYTMRPDGRRIHSLTGVGEHPLTSRFQLSEPAFSPSGRFLLVTGRDREHTEFAIIDLRDRRRLLGTGSGLGRRSRGLGALSGLRTALHTALRRRAGLGRA